MAADDRGERALRRRLRLRHEMRLLADPPAAQVLATPGASSFCDSTHIARFSRGSESHSSVSTSQWRILALHHRSRCTPLDPRREPGALLAEQRRCGRPACTGPGGEGSFDARLFDSVRGGPHSSSSGALSEGMHPSGPSSENLLPRAVAPFSRRPPPTHPGAFHQRFSIHTRSRCVRMTLV
jgi:hypothetical protein